MKKLLTLLLSVSVLAAFAQTPDLLNYQAIVKNSNGNPLVSTNLSVKVSILSDSVAGVEEFVEYHSVTTNNSGLFSFEIGSVSPLDVDWSSGSKFLSIEIDTNAGSNYVEYSTSKIVSVPYALRSATTESANKLNILDTVAATELSKTINVTTSPYSVTANINPNIPKVNIKGDIYTKIYVNNVFVYNAGNTGDSMLYITDNDIPFVPGDNIRFDLIFDTFDGIRISSYSVVAQ